MSPRFRTWALPILGGGPCRSRALVQATSRAEVFAYGAIPSGVLALTVSHEVASVAVAASIGGLAFRPIALALDGKRLPPRQLARRPAPIIVEEEAAPDVSTPGEFGLWMGEATGQLAAMGHHAGIKPGANVTLNLRDAAKNIAVFGETGTGKTTRVINHLLVQALDCDAGALIFDVRGDFYETALRAAQLTGKKAQRIGIGHLGVNLLEGLSPNTAAGFLESAFRLLGQGDGDSGFWVGLAVTRCENALCVLQYSPNEYSLHGLYRFIFDSDFRIRVIATARLTIDLSEDEADSVEVRRLQGALHYETSVFAAYSEKEHSGVNRTIETALSRFSDPELSDAFCTSGPNQARLSDTLHGAVFVVNLPREQFKAASRVVYMFLKERFFQALNSRAQMESCSSKERPVVFLCDEYQQVCSAGDANFFDTSRALNVIGIVASQSIEAYMHATGDEYAAMSLLANFTNLVAFRSTERTMAFVAGKLGDVDFWKTTESSGNATGRVLGILPFTKTTGVNNGRSVSKERQHLLNAQIFRRLEPEEAIALLTVSGRTFDDVIRVPQVTVEAIRDYC